MKYFLVILAGLFVLGCVSPSKKEEDSRFANNKNVIYDEEFDLLVAPEYDYESQVPYAQQIKITTKDTGVSANNIAKPAKQPVAMKVK